MKSFLQDVVQRIGAAGDFVAAERDVGWRRPEFLYWERLLPQGRGKRRNPEWELGIELSADLQGVSA